MEVLLHSGKASQKLLFGEQAIDLLQNHEFQILWDSLLYSCPWATCFQGKEYVLTFFDVYREVFDSLLIFEQTERRLTGIFILAKAKNKPLITAAGWDRAEYQTWICTPENNGDFIHQALTLLQQYYSNHVIHLKHLPTKTPLGWLKTNPKWKKNHVLRTYSRPLIDIDSNHFEKKLNNKTIKEKIKRLQKIGPLVLEKITDYLSFSAIINQLANQSDFRKGAAYDYLPTRDDPHLKPLLLGLFKNGLLHVTVLKVGEEIIAATVNIRDNNWLYLQGLNTHSPFYAKHSPGLIHFLMLGKLLAQENISVFDLTPGGDAYKEVLATRHDQVYELWIVNKWHAHLRIWGTEFVKKTIRENLEKRKKDPRIFRANALKAVDNVTSIRKRGLFKVLKNTCQQFFRNARYQAQPIRLNQSKGLKLMKINRNELEDFLCFDEKSSPISRWRFLEKSMRLFSLGEQAFTYTENGKLMACVWLSNKKNPDLKHYPVNAEDSTVLHESYHHPIFRPKFKAFLLQVAEDVSVRENIQPLVLVTLATEKSVFFEKSDKNGKRTL